ncbi:16S rRNA (uracil(1498)-N(3))-methyltransferase [Buchnera aphidicola (Macrosiphoniella sanborni)]|uniref:Ribosomal RNA small subunit methyltransferase E n=1 Tax=Buchnera aphidicola (Macrosiphoniella sanborni) TaxID=1241865 RepID=A0A4D6Y5V4_9GAMM|nr:16S rRNA (uracil(1498)-N(3))-methyltransferase [Buchnera aphidicola]QCI23933.1 16S rRNA (uracil(1498)-N(3))-methyltransferase [Buchnera aphidicola (Macrosiphoniella sanborni)]
MKIKKNIPRIYIENDLYINETYLLSKDNVHYLKKVLRVNNYYILEVFNNTNYIFFANIIYFSNNIIKIKIFSKRLKNIESPIHIHLGQVIPKHYKKMDLAIQKSIEMGVNIITPLFLHNLYTQNNNINISHKIQRWKKIAISACQQCQRNVIPEIKKPIDLFSWCKKNEDDIKIIFHPKAIFKINELQKSVKSIKIIIGSEIGFSREEIKKIVQYGFIPIKLGPRILRTETAAMVAITALQMQFGDLK